MEKRKRRKGWWSAEKETSARARACGREHRLDRAMRCGVVWCGVVQCSVACGSSGIEAEREKERRVTLERRGRRRGIENPTDGGAESG